MPNLWNDTIESHRREVREAIVSTTAALVDEHGLLSVTMSQIAEETGIGRATLYKYFSDVEAILLAWHQRQIGSHLAYLGAARDRGKNAGERLRYVLEAYAVVSRESHGHQDSELAALMHRGEQLAEADNQLRGLFRSLMLEGQASGDVRDDATPEELASYCLHAITAARSLRSKTANRRLVDITIAGLRPER